MNLNQLPVRVRTLSRFRAAHPWFDNGLTDWSLDVYKMVPEYIAENAAPVAASTAPTGDLTPSDYLGTRSVSVYYDDADLFAGHRIKVKAALDGSVLSADLP